MQTKYAPKHLRFCKTEVSTKAIGRTGRQCDENMLLLNETTRMNVVRNQVKTRFDGPWTNATVFN